MRYFRTAIENRIRDIGIARGSKPDGRRAAFLAGAMLLAALALFSMVFRSIKVRGQEQGRYKYYTSMEIQSGDTLWSIASEIAETYGLDTRACVEELKFMNNMKSDTIHEGNYLTIFYYDDTYK